MSDGERGISQNHSKSHIASTTIRLDLKYLWNKHQEA